MKNIIAVIIIVFVSIFSFFSFVFASSDKMDVSEKSVKTLIIKKNATRYCGEYGVKVLRIYNVKIDTKSVIKNNFGAIITSYVVTADVDVEKYGKFHTVYYVYTGEISYGEIYSVEGFFAAEGNAEHWRKYQRQISKWREMVKKNTALTQASIELSLKK